MCARTILCSKFVPRTHPSRTCVKRLRVFVVCVLANIIVLLIHCQFPVSAIRVICIKMYNKFAKLAFMVTVHPWMTYVPNVS